MDKYLLICLYFLRNFFVLSVVNGENLIICLHFLLVCLQFLVQNVSLVSV